MAKSSTSFGDGRKAPVTRRGKAFKTILLETMREKSLLELNPDSSKDDAEKAFVEHAAQRAFDTSDQSSATILNEFLRRSFPPLKPTNEAMVFDFPEDGTPTEKAFSIVDAISKGHLPADVGQTIISIIKDSVIIEESTDLKERIAALEAMVND